MQELLAALSDWLGVYLLIVNVATMAVYGADKRRAKHRRWRDVYKRQPLRPHGGAHLPHQGI